MLVKSGGVEFCGGRIEMCIYVASVHFLRVFSAGPRGVDTLKFAPHADRTKIA